MVLERDEQKNIHCENIQITRVTLLNWIKTAFDIEDKKYLLTNSSSISRIFRDKCFHAQDNISTTKTP